jgi:hypothetical protein
LNIKNGIVTFQQGGFQMKIAKMFSTLVLSLVMVVGAASAALAAPNDDVISALKTNHVPNDYIIQAENYLKNHTLTQSQADAVVAQIEKAGDIMAAAGTKDINKLSYSQQEAVANCVYAAGDALGMDITISKLSNGSIKVTAKDAEGKTVLDFTSSSVKQTGVNNSIIFAGVLLLVLSAGSLVVLRKRALA